MCGQVTKTTQPRHPADVLKAAADASRSLVTMKFRTHIRNLHGDVAAALNCGTRDEVIARFRGILSRAKSLFKTDHLDFWIEQLDRVEHHRTGPQLRPAPRARQAVRAPALHLEGRELRRYLLDRPDEALQRLRESVRRLRPRVGATGLLALGVESVRADAEAHRRPVGLGQLHRQVGETLYLQLDLFGWDDLGAFENYGQKLISVPYKPWLNKQFEPVDVTMPEKNAVVVLGLTLKDATGKALQRNFTTYIVSSGAAKKDEVRVVKNKKLKLVRFAPNSFHDM